MMVDLDQCISLLSWVLRRLPVVVVEVRGSAEAVACSAPAAGHDFVADPASVARLPFFADRVDCHDWVVAACLALAARHDSVVDPASADLARLPFLADRADCRDSVVAVVACCQYPFVGFAVEPVLCPSVCGWFFQGFSG